MTRRFQFGMRLFAGIADRITKLSTWVVALAVLCGWSLIRLTREAPPPEESASSPVVNLSESLRVRNLRATMEEMFSRSKVVRFLSWKGKWIGTYCDAEIELSADGTTRLTEYGYGVDSYDGSYSIDDDDSELTLSLKGYSAGWPTMRVYRNNSLLLLASADRSVGFVCGQRSGGYLPAGAGSLWPFRQIDE